MRVSAPRFSSQDTLQKPCSVVPRSMNAPPHKRSFQQKGPGAEPIDTQRQGPPMIYHFLPTWAPRSREISERRSGLLDRSPSFWGGP